MKKHAKKLNKPNVKISRRVTISLINYSWPGNVRELENIIERAMTLCENDIIVSSDLPEEINKRNFKFLEKTNKEDLSLYELEKEYILEVLDKCNGNKSKTAGLLGISRVTLSGKLKRYNKTKGSDV